MAPGARMAGRAGARGGAADGRVRDKPAGVPDAAARAPGAADRLLAAGRAGALITFCRPSASHIKASVVSRLAASALSY